ncbi:hypothetical protein SARC_05337 [Sphaeroforma arctica JP610]|uniref:Pre-rRNA-processing protein TSR2 homolog n=1 Tax=Sphaeroforma arctica JP610 TaxID=667725 RepID=A0A0L0G0M1_9EUKA|nr:hypothetical protein SARC_05337 [Sphaeroforma arctica JP610]KNC82386.1 hypothetical protein SARC_05337 [Sphaeroforma arctica JP610]|eukprot:XP_014156288.1 hypothetical protein SARC_05337 [Sphaeroforma arctica JP610]
MTGKKVDIDDLEDMLDEYIQIDFNCTAEDGSQRVVAELIFEAISKVDAGDMEWIKKTAIEYEQKLQKKTESGKRVEYFVDDALEAQRAKLASAAAEAKAAETAAARAEEEAAMEEDDGWTTVKKR